MAVFGYNEAVYGALCYIYGDDDNLISAEEKRGIKPRFLERHYLSNESMEAISYRWSLGPNDFYSDVINSLNDCSLTQRLEALKTFVIVADGDLSKAHLVGRIMNDIGIVSSEFNRYTGWGRV